MRPLRTFAALTAATALAVSLAACSSSADTAATPAAGGASASAGAASAPASGAAASGSADPAAAAAQAACDQILAGKMTQADAEAAAKTAGLESRIGSVDGKPNALTMDYNPNRVTFTVDGGVVTECTTG